MDYLPCWSCEVRVVDTHLIPRFASSHSVLCFITYGANIMAFSCMFEGVLNVLVFVYGFRAQI